jgi:hypothetical protein
LVAGDSVFICGGIDRIKYVTSIFLFDVNKGNELNTFIIPTQYSHPIEKLILLEKLKKILFFSDDGLFWFDYEKNFSLNRIDGNYGVPKRSDTVSTMLCADKDKNILFLKLSDYNPQTDMITEGLMYLDFNNMTSKKLYWTKDGINDANLITNSSCLMIQNGSMEKLEIFDLKTETVKGTISPYLGRDKYFITDNIRTIFFYDKHEISLTDFYSYDEKIIYKTIFGAYIGQINIIHNKSLLVFSVNDTIKFINLKNNQVVYQLIEDDYISNIQFTSDFSRMIVSAGYIKAYDISKISDTIDRQIPSPIISISPNPASDYIEISVGTHHDVPNQLAIFDILGIGQSTPSVLGTATPQEGNLRIDISSLSPGVYFVRIGDVVRKFVKY